MTNGPMWGADSWMQLTALRYHDVQPGAHSASVQMNKHPGVHAGGDCRFGLEGSAPSKGRLRVTAWKKP